MTKNIIAARLRALRDKYGLDQKTVAEIIGVPKRQTVSQIETGERRITGGELARLITHLGIELDYFTDPFRLEGEGAFSWRQSSYCHDTLNAYQQSAGQWLAAYRYLAQETDTPALYRKSLRLDKNATFDQAAQEGERIAKDFALGEVPAINLIKVMEDNFGILVLMVDAPIGISGAACRLTELDAVLVNRNEVVGRRNFDLAHELFHLLTWDAMPPERIESLNADNRVEKLANAFASALLMPEAILGDNWKYADSIPALAAMINEKANELQVSSQALKWRLASIKRISRAKINEIPDTLLRNNGRAEAQKYNNTPLFSKKFMSVMGEGIEEGLVSSRRAARLLGANMYDGSFGELFDAQGVDKPEGI